MAPESVIDASGPAAAQQSGLRSGFVTGHVWDSVNVAAAPACAVRPGILMKRPGRAAGWCCSRSKQLHSGMPLTSRCRGTDDQGTIMGSWVVARWTVLVDTLNGFGVRATSMSVHGYAIYRSWPADDWPCYVCQGDYLNHDDSLRPFRAGGTDVQGHICTVNVDSLCCKISTSIQGMALPPNKLAGL